MDKHLTSEQLSDLFVIHVFSKHGIPSHVTSDRGRQWISHFFRPLGEVLNMRLHFTSGYHPEGDGQTERVNQTLEQYVRIFCNYQQDDWVKLLPVAEFVYNNSPNATTGISPFYANKGYNPRLAIEPDFHTTNFRTRQHLESLRKIQENLRKHILSAQESIQKYADRKRLDPPDSIQVGNQVMVRADHFSTTRPSKKLSERLLGPYMVTEQVGTLSYRIKLPREYSRVHPVFHVSQLEYVPPNTITNRVQPPPPPVHLDDDGAHFEIEIILDSKYDKRFKSCPLRYKVSWFGFQNTEESTSWVGANDLDAQEYIDEFHSRYPHKPGPNHFPT